MPDIDRVSSTQRPLFGAAGFHLWSDLLFIHWQVPAALLQPLLPHGLTVDTYDGMAWLGLVPFQMFDVRPWWSPAVRGISNFPETNVRTYVHFQGRDPGVWFFSLDAARLLAVTLARWGWGLNYHWSRMSVSHAGDRITYRSRRMASGILCNATIEVGDHLPQGQSYADSRVAVPGSLENFLIDRYLLYSTRFGYLYRGQVYHRPYPLRAARLLELDQGLLQANGISITADPCHVVYSPGVKVEVFGLKRIARAAAHPCLATGTT